MAFDPEAVREFERSGWNRAASSYEGAFATASRQFVPALLDAACVGAGMDVLDVCCGPGIVTEAAAARGARVVGLDFSAEMLAIARARLPGVRFEHGDAEAMPFPDARFDAVVSNFGIHHVPRPVLALREAWRLLRPGGRFAFTVWDAPFRNLAWKLVQDAVSQRGDPSLSTAPAPGGGFASGADCLGALRGAGFDALGTTDLSGLWRHADGAGLLDALRAGTARMAAMINAQPAAMMAGISAAVVASAERYRDGVCVAVPIAAIVAHGVRV